MARDEDKFEILKYNNGVQNTNSAHLYLLDLMFGEEEVLAIEMLQQWQNQ